MKPIVSIKLVTNIEREIWGTTTHQRRPDGKDYWEVVATITTKENQVSKHTFHGMKKVDALNKAYLWLEKQYIDEWFPMFYLEQYTLYQGIFSSFENGKRNFEAIMDDVSSGKITKTQFLNQWQHIVEKYYKLPKQCDPVPPPPGKWSFWDWFR